jgi:GDPmannose 4,6-dehydratase
MKINNIQDIGLPLPGSKPCVFVTGVSGQDGSHMVDYLLKNTNHFVIGGARRLSVDNHKNIAHLENEPRFQLVNFDLTDSHSVYKLVERAQPAYFINFAAQSFVASSWDFAHQTWETNSTGVLNCLEAIRNVKPDCRFYNAGSSEEFGSVEYSPQDEKHPLRPRSPYGASKAAARQLVKVYRESFGLYAVQGWLFNHEGTRRGEEFVTRKISNHIAKWNMDGVDHLLELGNLDAKRDWSDAEDMMDAVWRMLNQEKYNVERPWINFQGSCNYSSQIKDYVVSSGESHSIREFVEEAFKVVGVDNCWWLGKGTDEVYYMDAPSAADGPIELVKVNPKFYRPAEVETLLGDHSLITTELGWKPKVGFKALVEKMVKNDLSLM